jgi:hypothetical protein
MLTCWRSVNRSSVARKRLLIAYVQHLYDAFCDCCCCCGGIFDPVPVVMRICIVRDASYYQRMPSLHEHGRLHIDTQRMRVSAHEFRFRLVTPNQGVARQDQSPVNLQKGGRSHFFLPREISGTIAPPAFGAIARCPAMSVLWSKQGVVVKIRSGKALAALGQ